MSNNIDSTPWLDAIKSLKAYFESLKIARHVEAGAMSPEDYDLSLSDEIEIKDNDGNVIGTTRTKGMILIIRNQETAPLVPPNGFRGDSESTISLYIEQWVRSDTPNPLDGYEDLAALEAKVIMALNKWSNEYKNGAGNTFDLISAKIVQVLGDGDSRRPFLGSRIIFEIDYSL